MSSATSSPHSTTSGYGEHEAAMVAYRAAGEARAAKLGNRGPIRFNKNGDLHEDILEAYWRCGFYIFESVLKPEELADIEQDVLNILDRAPLEPGGQVDQHGRPALNVGHKGGGFAMVKPLSDPIGGSDRHNGRHPTKMIEPIPPDGAPDYVVQVVSGSLQFSDACLRVYGHPELLGAAASINGADFSPFNEVIFIKQPGLGASVAWHQDGTTHWDTPLFGRGSHGFNFMAQLYGCNSSNGLWLLPGSHLARADIKAMCDTVGSDRLPGAVPMLCAPGDVGITNRQTVHGSFANTSPDMRVTINFGFHPRKSVLGARGNGIHSPGSEKIFYDANRITERSKILGLAIKARQQRYPDETPFQYQPHTEAGLEFEWNDAARHNIKDYNLLDLGI